MRSVHIDSKLADKLFVHCGRCKQRDRMKAFDKGGLSCVFKCPFCGAEIKRVYENKVERKLNEKIKAEYKLEQMERGRYLDRFFY